jgi:glucokinase
MAQRTVVAVDLGGTKATVALVTETGQVLGRSSAPSPRMASREAVEGFLARAQRLPGFEGAVAVGLALPAIVDEEGLISWAAPSIPDWDGVPARSELEAVFGIPGSVQFDGYAATLGEAIFGGGRGARSVVTIIVGTGMGAGVWIDGQVLRGVAGVAGAVGWNRWPIGEGAVSEPAESVASGPGILAAARRRDQSAAYPDTRAVFRAARSGDPAARAAIAEAATIAGSIAGGAIDLIAPEVLVWTGGVGSRADFSTAATRVAQRCCQPFAVRRTRFVRSRLGAESSLMGAAAGALAAIEGRLGT